MAFVNSAPPPDGLVKVKVSRKTLAQITEQIDDNDRISYDMGGYPNIAIGGWLFFVGPRKK